MIHPIYVETVFEPASIKRFHDDNLFENLERFKHFNDVFLTIFYR